MLESRTTEFGDILDARQQTHKTHPLGEPLRRSESAQGNIAMSRPMSGYDLPRSESQQYNYNYNRNQRNSTMSMAGLITGSASNARDLGNQERSTGNIQRTMTYEELAERHRKRISKLQDPVSSKMKEEVALVQAKEKWERQKRQEKEEMKRREADKALRQQEREREGGNQEGWRPTGVMKEDSVKKAEEWRRSVHNGLDGMAGEASSRGQGSGYGQPQVGSGNTGKRRMSSHLAN